MTQTIIVWLLISISPYPYTTATVAKFNSEKACEEVKAKIISATPRRVPMDLGLNERRLMCISGGGVY
jgi:hypothetical protein